MSAADLRRREDLIGHIVTAAALAGMDDEPAFALYCHALAVHPEDEDSHRLTFPPLLDAARAVTAPEGDSAAPARRLDVSALLDAELPPIPYRVHHLAADGFLTVLAGHGGEGKSWVALAMCIGVACGSAPGGIPCTQGHALYIDGENGERLIARRYRAAAGPRQGVAMYEAQTLDLADPAHAAWIADLIRGEGAQLVVLDSLRSLAPRLEENNGDTVAPVMRHLRNIARDTGAALIVLHHRPKNTGAAYRGSSVLRDQTDILAVLARAEKDPEGKTRRYLHADGARGGKFRIDAEPDDRWMHLRPTGDYVTLDPAEPFTSATATERPPTVADQLADQIADVLAGHPDGMTRADLCRHLGRTTGDGSVRRALDQLAAAGTVHRAGTGPYRHTDPEQAPLDLASHVGNPAGKAATGVASHAPIGVAGNGNGNGAGKHTAEPVVLGPYDDWTEAVG